MVARLIETIRHGQARLKDQRLADLAVQRGLVNQKSTLDLLADSAAGTLGERLVSDGHLAAHQLSTLSDELEVLELMETIADDSSPAEVRAAADIPGHRMGRYVLVDQLGAGGMGVVWRAWDGQLSRWVAVKRLKVKEPKLISRFMREASLLAKLEHPNITRVYEVGVHEGQPFLVMEIVDGASPGEEAMDRQAAAEVVRDAAQAVQYAHEHKIIHRDLKPSNLLVSSEGRVFVTDFGLARMREESISLTASGALLGTPSYMAPEQAQGRDADDQTDVYGLGATLYALVEGRPPYVGELVHEVVKRVASSNPPRLSGNDDLVAVVQKAMERDREDRYETAGELAEELQRFVDDTPVLAKEITSIERVWRRARRRPALSSAIAAGTLIAAILIGWGAQFTVQYVSRNAEIKAASEFVSQGDSVIDELRKMYSSGSFEVDWEQAALRDLESFAGKALQAAPNYAPAALQLGLTQLWQNQNQDAIESFSIALEDDPNLHEARAYRVVALFGISDASSPQIVQDIDGFRVIAGLETPDALAELAVIEADLAELPDDYPVRRLGNALVAVSRGQFDDGLAAIDQYLESRPYDRMIRSVFMWSLLAAGEYQRLIETADQMIARTPSVAAAWSMKGFGHAGLNDLDAAIDAMQQSLKVMEDNDRRHWIGFWTFEQGHYEESLAIYEQILEADPDHRQSLLGRATVLLITGDTESAQTNAVAALRDAERAVSLAPNDAYGYFVVGQAATRIDPPKARAAYEKAIEMDPEAYGGVGAAMLATVLFGQGETDAAIESLETALQVEPDQFAWLNMLARFHLMVGQYQEVEILLKDREEDLDSLNILASARSLSGRTNDAMKAIDLALRIAPDDPSLIAESAYYLAGLGEKSAAESAFSKALALAPADPDILERRALAWFQADEYQLAAAAADDLIAAQPQYAYAHQLRGHILYQLSAFEAAADAYVQASRLDPGNSAHDIYRADVLMQLGQWDGASELLAPIVAREPGNADARRAIANLSWYQSDFESAEREFSLLLTTPGAVPSDYLARAQIRLASEDCTGAGKDIEMAGAQGSMVPPALGDLFRQLCPEIPAPQ